MTIVRSIACGGAYVLAGRQLSAATILGFCLAAMPLIFVATSAGADIVSIAPAEDSVTIEPWEVTLPAGQTETTETQITEGPRGRPGQSGPEDRGWVFQRLETKAEDQVVYEVIVRVFEAPGSTTRDMQLAVDRRLNAKPLVGMRGFLNEFRDVGGGIETYELGYRDVEGPDWSDVEQAESVKIVREVTLRRLDSCFVRIQYTGDVRGEDFGKLAYYNNFLKPGSRYAAQGGVARATGSGADPQRWRRWTG
ncbi:MAG: hypothetical protein R3E86_06215 [Pseudomonadales bacterium]